MSSSHIPSDFFTPGWHNGTRSVVALVRLSVEMESSLSEDLSSNVNLMRANALDSITISIQRPLRICAKVFKALSAMFLGSVMDNFSHATFTKGSNLNMIGITAAGFSTTLHMLPTIKQQVRLTSSTLSFRPRERTGSIATKASDCTFCIKCSLPSSPRIRGYW